MSLVIHTVGPKVTRACGALVAPMLCQGDVMLLCGDLGAGKTQLTKGIAEGLGVVDPVTSPTFNILLVHEGRLPLYHFDLYRLERAEQLEDVDYWGTLEGDGVAVVEWGDRFTDSIPVECLVVRLLITADDARDIVLEPSGERATALAGRWARASADVSGATVCEERPT